ncbi:TPA: hypothetical protein ACHVIN_001171, partial [Streptococcus suis]
VFKLLLCHFIKTELFYFFNVFMNEMGKRAGKNQLFYSFSEIGKKGNDIPSSANSNLKCIAITQSKADYPPIHHDSV